MNILLFGPPGSGKGTHSKKIVEEFGFKHVSFGEVLRNHIDQDSTFGKIIKKIVSSGKLVSNDLMLEVLEDELECAKTYNGIIQTSISYVENKKLVNKVIKTEYAK